MIDLYTWPTPNGHKVHIMLEETGLDYTVHPVDITQGEQFHEDFLKISPNNKIPAMVDQQGPEGKAISIFESGAMLIYLSEKTKQFLPEQGEARYKVLEWLMFQMGGLGPMLGQAHHFRQYAPEQNPYGIERYTNEASRLYGVLDKRLKEVPYLAGDEYSIADMAVYPWIVPYDKQGQDLNKLPYLKKWFEKVGEREAVKRGMEVLSEKRKNQKGFDQKAQEILFGKKQYQSRQ